MPGEIPGENKVNVFAGWLAEFPDHNVLVKVEFDLYADLHIHGLAIFQGRLESPLLNSLDCFGIQAKTKPSRHSDITRMPRGVHNKPEHTSTLFLSPTGVFCVVRIRRRDCCRGRNPAPNTVNATTNPAAASGSHPWPVSNTHSTARS